MQILTLAALAAVAAALVAQSPAPARTLRLPDTSYEYANATLPAHFQSARGLDNTPEDNPITDAGATLGRVLFYDTTLSANSTTSCSSCHRQQHAFSDPNRVSRGFDGRHTDRHAMNLTGLRYYPPGRFFWDERGGNLEDAVLLPIRNPIEMGEDPARLPRKLAAATYLVPGSRRPVAPYPELFRRAFGDPRITEARIARALAQFLRSLVSYRSRFDEGLARATSDADGFESFTRQENRGKALFLRNCASCHLESQDSLFALLVPANNGTELHPLSADGGLGDVTLNALDAGRFKSPTLRNVEVAGPYMHNGSLATLEDVIDHYSRNFNRHPNLDFRMLPLNFTDSEKAALVAFLKTLTDRAFLADPRFSDPFEPPGTLAPPSAPPARATVAATPLPARGDVETVIARVLSFDADGDGDVHRSELAERMQDIVRRGDRNANGALDRDELRAMASSSPVIGAGTGMAPRARRSLTIQLRSAADPGVAGLVEDLELPAGRREAALAAVAQGESEIEQAAAASVERFRDEVRTLLAQDQLAMLDGALEAHAKTLRTIVGASLAPTGRPSFPLPRVGVDRAIRNLGLSGETLVTLDAAFGRHLDRVRVLATDRSGLLRRLSPVLTADELIDFAAALERHGPAAITVEGAPPQ